METYETIPTQVQAFKAPVAMTVQRCGGEAGGAISVEDYYVKAGEWVIYSPPLTSLQEPKVVEVLKEAEFMAKYRKPVQPCLQPHIRLDDLMKQNHNKSANDWPVVRPYTLG